MQWTLHLFGPPRLERNGKPVEVTLRKGIALLVYCAVTRRPHSRDALATLLWPDKDQQSARANLRRLLYELVQRLGDSFFDLAAERVALYANIVIWLDVEQFQRFLSAPTDLQPAGAQAAVPEPEPVRVARLKEAAGLYAADFMAGFTLADCPEFDDWQFFQREELRRAFALLLGQLVTLHEAGEGWEEALQYARRWLALDPLEEEVHRRLMRLYAFAGQPGAAMRQYEECARVLARELDAVPEEETTDLFTRIRTKRFPAAEHGPHKPAAPAMATGEPVVQPVVEPVVEPVTTIDASPWNPASNSASNSTFPKYATPFVGRRLEVAELLRRLHDPDCRLLTLVGPGGIGKTRLALAAAQLVLEPARAVPEVQPAQFRDGVYFVPLQPVSTPDRLVPVVADVIGLRFYEGEAPAQQLIRFLQKKEILLVLDNFEHLLEGAELVGEMLAAAPGVKLLVTSREALKLQEEWFHPITGMRLPPHHHAGTLEPDPNDPVYAAGDAGALLAASDAAQLFIQAARRASVAFDPHAEQQAIARICRLVDGIPLALELAASWLKVLSCAQIAQEIENGMDILVTRHQNVAVRHRSMRVILDQSWQMLPGESQRVLRRLSVFQGGFLQDAAAAIGADLLMLAELVDIAWIYRTPAGRYQMHELLRQYAADKLAGEPGEEGETQQQHMTFYLRLLGSLEAALTGPEQRTALDQLAGEIDNIQSAWTRAAARHDVGLNDAALIDTALHALYLFYDMRSRYAEGRQLLAAAMSHVEGPVHDHGGTAPTELSCRLLGRLGMFHLHLGEMEAAQRCFAAVVAAGACRRELAFVYVGLGELNRQQGNHPAAEAALHASLSLAQASDDRQLMAEALLGMAEVSSSFADYAAGERFARESLALCRQLQRPDLTARAVAAVAWSVNCLGDYAESERCYRETLAISETIGNPYGIALATNFLGWVAYCEGGARLAEAAALHAQALAIWRHIGNRSFVAMCLGDSALVAYEQGDYGEAQRLAQEGLTVAEELMQADLTAYNLNVLGAATCSLGELAAGRRHLFRSLQITHQLRMPDKAALMLYFLALLFVRESAIPAAAADQQAADQQEEEEKQLAAVELLAFVIEHPATWQLVRERSARVQADLLARLPVEAAATALARGQQQTFDEIVSRLLLEDQG